MSLIWQSIHENVPMAENAKLNNKALPCADSQMFSQIVETEFKAF